MAEMRFGTPGRQGVVMLITIGTGLGSAIFVNGHLHPNTELGHLKMKGRIAEHYCSDAVRQREEPSWGQVGTPLNRYLQRLNSCSIRICSSLAAARPNASTASAMNCICAPRYCQPPASIRPELSVPPCTPPASWPPLSTKQTAPRELTPSSGRRFRLRATD